MTSEELIESLKKADPSGKMEVVVGNEPVWFVHTTPAYWDGKMERIYWNGNTPVKGEYVAAGSKLGIRTFGIDDAIWEYPDFPVDFTTLESSSPGSIAYYKDHVEKIRKESQEVEDELSAKKDGT